MVLDEFAVKLMYLTILLVRCLNLLNLFIYFERGFETIETQVHKWYDMIYIDAIAMEIPYFFSKFAEDDMSRQKNELIFELPRPPKPPSPWQKFYVVVTHIVDVEYVEEDLIKRIPNIEDVVHVLKRANEQTVFIYIPDDYVTLFGGGGVYRLDMMKTKFKFIVDLSERVSTDGLRLTHIVKTSWIPYEFEYLNDEAKKRISELGSQVKSLTNMLTISHVKSLEHENQILKELVDKPDGAGCKFGYDEISKVLK